MRTARWQWSSGSIPSNDVCESLVTLSFLFNVPKPRHSSIDKLKLPSKWSCTTAERPPPLRMQFYIRLLEAVLRRVPARSQLRLGDAVREVEEQEFPAIFNHCEQVGLFFESHFQARSEVKEPFKPVFVSATKAVDYFPITPPRMGQGST